MGRREVNGITNSGRVRQKFGFTQKDVQPASSGHLRPFVQTPPTDLAGFKANGRLKHLNTLCARGVTF